MSENQAIVERLLGRMEISPQMADFLAERWGQTAALMKAIREDELSKLSGGWEPIETALRSTSEGGGK